MAQFRATIEGQRGEASRLGSKNSGLVARINGWHGGVRVEARHSETIGDCFDIYATNGSGYGTSAGYLGYVDSKGQWFPAPMDAQVAA